MPRQKYAISTLIDAYLFDEKTASMLDPGREHFKLRPSAFSLRPLTANSLRISRRTHEKHYVSCSHSCFYRNGNLIGGKATNSLRAYWFLLECLEEFFAERTKENKETADVCHR